MILLKALVIFSYFSFSLGRIPTINENPTDQSVSRGDPATLNCGARGQPEPFVTWYKDGVAVDLESAPDHMVLLPDGALFFLRTVENARQQDSGLYHCKAENKDGSVESKPARLTVTYMRPKFGDVERQLEVEEGQPLLVQCRPPEGNPVPKVYWEKDGHTLVNDDYFVIKQNGDLFIPEAGIEDGGSYVCLASNSDVTRRDLPVTVKVARRVVEIRQEIIPAIPRISDAYMVDPVTGIVHWTAVGEHVTGYIILLTANSAAVTNITVEADVTQIKLHSLDPGLAYSVQVAAQYGDTHGDFSPSRQLMYKTHEVVLVNNDVNGEIPVKVWAIAMAIVIIVTLTIVMAAALLCYKTKKFGSSRHSTSCSEYGVRNITWDRRPNISAGLLGTNGTAGSGGWDDTSPTTSFRSQNRLLNTANQECAGGVRLEVGANGYEYAVPSHHLTHHLLHPIHYGDGRGGGGSGGSNHYASNTILKPAYYEPLNLVQHVTSSDSSFESEYKTPLDIKSSR